MSNVTILQKVYALTSDTREFLSANQLLMTDGKGGTFWTPIFSTLNYGDGGAIGFLPSTIQSLSTIGFSNTSTFNGFAVSTQSTTSTSIGWIFSSLVVLSNTIGAGGVQEGQLVSTVTGLGTIGYISSQQLLSSVAGLGTVGYISSQDLVSTVRDLGTAGYISSQQLESTVKHLGTTGYISSLSLQSTFISTTAGLGTASYVSSTQVTSSLTGLGSLGYLSSQNLISSSANLGSLGYVSSTQLFSSVTSLGTLGYISSSWLQSSLIGYSNPTTGTTTANLISTVGGLGSAGYVSTISLVSTTSNILSTTLATLSTIQNIRFDTADSVQIIGGVNSITIQQTEAVIYVSSFFMSSVTLANTLGSQITAQYTSPYKMVFSTANVNLGAYSSFVNSNSLVTIDYYPTILFSKLATGASNVAMIEMSTMAQFGQTILSTPVTTSYLFAGNTTTTLENTSVVNSSNLYNTPIKLQFSTNVIRSLYPSTMTFVHVLNSSINNGSFQNALHNCNVTPYVSRQNGVFVSVQNLLRP